MGLEVAGRGGAARGPGESASLGRGVVAIPARIRWLRSPGWAAASGESWAVVAHGVGCCWVWSANYAPTLRSKPRRATCRRPHRSAAAACRAAARALRRLAAGRCAVADLAIAVRPARTLTCTACGRVPSRRRIRDGLCTACREAGAAPSRPRTSSERSAAQREHDREAVRAYERRYRQRRLAHMREMERQRSAQRRAAAAANPALRARLREIKRAYERLVALRRRARALGWRTVADCRGGKRPCPLTGCRFHAAGLVPADHLAECSCVLDAAERGPMTLREVADLCGVTPECVRQWEAAALAKLARLNPAVARSLADLAGARRCA